MAGLEIRTFYLYGEPHRTVGDNFVHVESLDDRSRPSEWTIAPHSHAELAHIFALREGGGAMRADGTELLFEAPCLLLVPARTVHGFNWYTDSSGTVITMAARYVQELARHDAHIGAAFAKSDTVALGPDEVAWVGKLTDVLMREFSWSAPGHHAAVDSAILALLVLALRHARLQAQLPARPGHQAATVARFRDRIEQRFRLRESVAVHASALAVSESALRLACARIAAASPAQMLDQRAVLEARRALVYSNLTVAEIGFSVGFADPAYFSRFFTRHTGMSPRRYRETQNR